MFDHKLMFDPSMHAVTSPFGNDRQSMTVSLIISADARTRYSASARSGVYMYAAPWPRGAGIGSIVYYILELSQSLVPRPHPLGIGAWGGATIDHIHKKNSK